MCRDRRAITATLFSLVPLLSTTYNFLPANPSALLLPSNQGDPSPKSRSMTQTHPMTPGIPNEPRKSFPCNKHLQTIPVGRQIDKIPTTPFPSTKPSKNYPPTSSFLNRFRTNSTASASSPTRPSNCASSNACKIFPNIGPGAYPSPIKSAPVSNGSGFKCSSPYSASFFLANS